MTAFHIRTLQHDDAAQLLLFETANRGWFEQTIEPRAAAFYSPGGVAEHISEFLAAHANGTRHPCVIVDATGAVIGRANLKEIDGQAGTAEVGYRIAASHVGHGLASHAVRHLVDVARAAWRLTHLHAFVAGTNPASARVLEKCGFTPGGTSDHDAADGTPVFRYALALD
jgi:ribosomal-protein-alanine N-acetyltransferase